MSEFSTGFSFDLQRFAPQTFKGAQVGDETGVTLSDMFTEAGAAKTKKDASSYTGKDLMWNTGALVELTPQGANASVGGAIMVVAGTYDTVATNEGKSTGYVVNSVTAVDANDLGTTGSATFKNLGNTAILNPKGTITVGDNTATFSGTGAKTEDTTTYGDATNSWDVGTVINVKSGKISNVAATAGETITANSVSADFVNGGTATFDGKSFASVTSFASGGTAQVNVDGGTKIVLNVDETSTSVADGATAITTAFDGQTVKSVTFAGKNAKADVTFGGTAIVGSDITIGSDTVNIANASIAGTSTSQAVYKLGAEGGSILDITNVEQVTKSNKTVSVDITGKETKYIVAKDYYADTETGAIYTDLTVGGVTYSFNDENGPDGNGGVFEITNGQVTGFVFRDKGDSITIPQGTNLTNFHLYQGGNSNEDLAADFDEANTSFTDIVPLNINLKVDSTTNDYVITKNETQSGDEVIQVEVFDSTTVSVGDASIGLTLPTTKDNRSSAPTSAVITIGTDGTLMSVAPGNNAAGAATESETASFDVAGVEITFSGMNNSNVSQDFAVGGVKFNTASGEFAYTVGSDTEKTGATSSEASFKMVNEDDEVTQFAKVDTEATDTVTPKIVLAETESTGDEQPDGKLTLFGVEYNYSSPQGKAYLEASTTTAGRVDFVFVNEGDTITIPEENALDLYYQNNFRDAEVTKAPLTAPVSDGESYSITMTKDTNRRSALAEFELFGMAAGDTVTAGEATFEFSAEGGKFAFSSETTAAGFTAASGTVTMNPTAAALLAQASEDAALFEINGTGVNITATVDTTNELVYNQDDKSLAGLASGTVVDSGVITKIYAPSTAGEFTFGTGDDAKPYTAATMGDFGVGTAAFFTLTDGAVTGFTFVDVDDEITADDFSYIELTDRTTGNTFDAPIVTATADGEPARARIIKTEEDYDMDGDYDVCYAIEASDSNLAGKAVLFTDGTEASFNNANADTQLFFGTDGKLLSILGLSTEGNEVTLTKIDSELGAVLIDGNEVEITGEGFTYRLTADNEPSIIHVLGGTTIIKAAGVSYVATAEGEVGNGTFTFGDKVFTVGGNENGVTFSIDDEITVSGIDDITGTESVTGALNGLELNGASVALTEATAGTEYTFSGTSFAGLKDGDAVTTAGNVTDFITAEEGTFTVLGESMAVAGDSAVKFSIADGSLTAVSELSGTATGDFSGDLTVNSEDIKVTGDDDNSVAVTGTEDESAVAAIANVGGSVALEQIGSASVVETNADGTFTFVEAGQTFATSGSSDGVVFGITEGKVTSIDDLDQQLEAVKGDFSDDGVSVNGSLVQVENNGQDITVIYGSESGTGIYGLKDGARVVSASGINVAVLTEETGSVTFANGTFNVAGDSNGHVGFMLDSAGNVTSVFDLDETATITGALSGISINTTDDPIQIGDGNDSLSYNPTEGIAGVVDGNTVTSADGASKVFVEGDNFSVTFGEEVFSVAGASGGVTFLVTDKNNVVGVEDLAEGATLTGALGDVTAINGASFSVLNDNDFAVVGAASGISEIQNLSASATVAAAGGATLATTDEDGAFTFGDKTFTTLGDSAVEFTLNDNNVTNIGELSGIVSSASDNFNGVTVNGQSFAISGDQDDLSVAGTDDASGIKSFAGVGGESVTIANAGGASAILTNTSGTFNFTQSNQSFTVDDDVVAFNLTDNAVSSIDFVEGTVEGNFDGANTVNGKTFDVTDSDGILRIGGNSDASGIETISKVNGGAVINNVGGAAQVITESTGSFSFAGHTNPFEVTGDESVTFNMDTNEDAKAIGIESLDGGAVRGDITDFSVNGTSITVEGDEDSILAYAVDGEDKTLGEVGGDDVTITESGDADEIELVKDGTYTVDGKAYDIAAGGSATLGMNGMSVASIDGIDQDGEQVKGDFTENISVGGQNVQVLGDDEVTVARENGQLVLSGLNDGATIEAADDIYKANVEEAGTFADTDAKTVNVGSDSAIISLDGAAHIVGLSNAGNVGGDISGLVIDGKAPVSVISAPTEDIPEVHDNTDLTYENGVLGGVIANDTVISAGDASVVSADGEDGTYTFGTGTDAQVFALEGDGDGIEFSVKNSTVVTAVSGVGEDATLKGALNGLSVNGSLVSIAGDDEFDAVGAADGSLKALEGVGGDVTVVSAGGAEEIRTDGVGNFTFNKSGQKFAVAGDSAVTFGINGDESVTSVSDLDGTVAGDFSNEIAVNGYDVKVTGDADGVSVVGGDDGLTVNEINDVEAGASVVSSGNATAVGAVGEGVFTFVEGSERFSVAGDDAVTFTLNNGDVTGVTGLSSGTISFSTDSTPAFEINPDKNDIVRASGTSTTLTVNVDSAGYIVGVAGEGLSTISGIAGATIAGTSKLTNVNGKPIDITDADNSFNVVVNADGDIDKVTAVTGNAIINVADASIEADADGEFIVNGETYTVVDNDNKFGLTTDRNGDLTSVTSLEGSLALEIGYGDISVNGQYVEIRNNDGDDEDIIRDGVTIAADGTNISVAGMVDDGTINGALDNASIAVPGNESIANNAVVMHVNDHNYVFFDDEDGVTVNGAGGVRGLDDGAYMLVTEKGTYTVNGDVISADVGDSLMGADTGAYLYDPDNILVRKTTPLKDIEEIVGVPTNRTTDSLLGSEDNPVVKASLQAVFEDETFDWDRPLKIYTTNPEERSAQDIDLSDTAFSKEVHLFNGPQNLAFNDAGGNVVQVEDEYYDSVTGTDKDTSGVKNITLGDGGDLAVIDMKAGIGNAVNIAGGTGDDSIFVRDNVNTTFDMSAGGADKVVTFAKANARIALENYDYTTGAGIKFDQHETRDIASAIKAGNIAFGDGVVSLKTASGATEISLNGASGGTASVGGSVVNLFTPEGTRQVVGFTHSAGGQALLDSTYTEDVIFIGNSDGKKSGGSTFQGGAGNDTAFAGAGDVVDLGEGVNVVSLQDDVNRRGAFVNISAGNTVIENTNSTLDEIHGDTLGVDLTQMEVEFDGTNLIVKSKEGASVSAYATVAGADKDGTISYDTASELASSADLAESADESDSVSSSSSDSVSSSSTESVAASATASPLVADHNYTNQLINSNGTLVRAAVGATNSVIDVKLDEDFRANYYKGDNSGLTFGSYNGRVLLDLEGDQFENVIDDQIVTVQGFTSVQAGTEFNYIKGSDENETFLAGRGESHLYGDGGKNLLVGYNGNDKEGQTTFYVLGHSNDAANTIQAFDFVSDDNYTNNNRITADKLEVDLNTNYVNRVELSNDDVVVNVTNRDQSATESVIIQGVVDSLTGYGQDILISGDGVVDDVIAQVGGDKLNFDKFANYYNATGKNATIDVANDKDFAQVWLDGSKGKTFVGDIHVVNASLYAGAAELAGNDYNNVIFAGSGETSLWGGHKGDDELYAGSGKDTFYYTLGNGTDTIFGAKDGDVVNLAGVTLDQIVGAEFSGSGDPIQGVALNFRDGGKLYIGDSGTNDVSYVVQGETYVVNEDRNGFVKKA